ncbi:MAG: F0F1 ATP synthase subunit epsilon [Anaerolineales bacterium]
MQIVSPERVVYEEEVDWLQVPLPDGLLGIWPGHAPLIALLAQGTIQFSVDGTIEEMAVEEGILRVDRGRCVVLIGVPVAGDVTADVASDALELEDVLHESLSDEEIEDL